MPDASNFADFRETVVTGTSMKTFLPKVEALDRKWYLVDASSQVLGRLASRIASILMGKEKPTYTDFLDTGDFVVVVNVDKVRLTGKKWDDKFYFIKIIINIISTIKFNS